MELSDTTNKIVWIRSFLEEQGYEAFYRLISMNPATVYQDNMSTIALVKIGKSNSDRILQTAIRFFFVADKVASS